MLKKIKFNLECDGKSVASLEALKENFNICDIIEHFKSQKLHKWLEVRGYAKELEAIKKLKHTNQGEEFIQFVRDVSAVFEYDLSLDEAKKLAILLNYQSKKEDLPQQDAQSQEIIKNYHQGFKEHIEAIIAHKDDVAVIKTHLEIIQKDFWDLFLLHHESLFYVWYHQAPLALFVGLGLEQIRFCFWEYPKFIANVTPNIWALEEKKVGEAK